MLYFSKFVFTYIATVQLKHITAASDILAVR